MSTRRSAAVRETKGTHSKLATARRSAAALLRTAGARNEEIAEALEVHASTVSNWFSEPDVRKQVEINRVAAVEQAKGLLAANAVTAAQVLVEGLNGKLSPTRLRFAVAVLDRIGVVALREEEAKRPVQSLSQEELEVEFRDAVSRLRHYTPEVFQVPEGE